jgi:hypothetical protein
MLYKFVKWFLQSDPQAFVGQDGDLTVSGTNLSVHDGVTPGGFLLNPIKQCVVYLSSADLLNSSTPIELLPAPGDNYMYVVTNVSYTLVFGTTPYSGDGGGAGLWYGGSISVDTGDNGVFAGSSTQTQQTLPYSAINGQPITPLTNVGLCMNEPITPSLIMCCH